MGISGRALLAAMGMSEGRLSGSQERLYYDLAFLAGAGNGYLPSVDIREALDRARTPDERRQVLDRENPIRDIFHELDAFADPSQTSRKISWSTLGRVAAGRADGSTLQFRDIDPSADPPRISVRGVREPDPGWIAAFAAEKEIEVRGRLRPLLEKFGLSWPRSERSGTHRYRG